MLERSYVLNDFKQQSAGTGVIGMVYVQASWALDYSLLEADYVANLAAHDRFVQGMVAYAPLEYGDQVHSYLNSLVSRGLVIKGIRRALADVTDKTFNFDSYIRGIQILPEYGLSFDILGNYHAQGPGHLDMALKIAQQAPLTGTQYTDGYQQGRLAASLAIAAAISGVRARYVQGHVLMPYYIVTRENVDQIQPDQRW